MFFDDDDAALRNQILTYHATSTMVDSERAVALGLPNGCRIREGAKIISPEKLKIGEHCWIGENAILDASGGLIIGSHVSVGLSVFIWTHDSHKMNVSGDNTRANRDAIERKPTKIGNNVFIGGPSVIMAGVEIGNGCVIAPMSLVHKNLPDNTVFAPYRNMLDSENRIRRLETRLRSLEGKGVPSK